MNNKPNQINMFSNGKDLPIFSGTAPAAHDEQFNPGEEIRQKHLFTCKFCHDTGQVIYKPGQPLAAGYTCQCPVGQSLRAGVK